MYGVECCEKGHVALGLRSYLPRGHVGRVEQEVASIQRQGRERESVTHLSLFPSRLSRGPSRFSSSSVCILTSLYDLQPATLIL